MDCGPVALRRLGVMVDSVVSPLLRLRCGDWVPLFLSLLSLSLLSLTPLVLLSFAWLLLVLFLFLCCDCPVDKLAWANDVTKLDDIDSVTGG